MLLHKIITLAERLSLDDLYSLDAALRNLIAKREREEVEPIPVKAGRDVVEERKVGSRTLRLEYVKCGKPNCRCAGGQGHGPYWYAYYRVGRKLKSEYIGKESPAS